MYFRLDAAVTHLLLDEFQDTSLEQWQVLSPFAEEVAAHADGGRELLVVGDTKQAIYGWRGGCVELFDVVEAMVPRRRATRRWWKATAPRRWCWTRQRRVLADRRVPDADGR